jgi:cell division protein FtsB
MIRPARWLRCWWFFHAPWVPRRRLQEALDRIDMAQAQILHLEMREENLKQKIRDLDEEADAYARKILAEARPNL